MKLMTLAIVLTLTGCATRPMTPEQQAYRLQLLQMATQVHPYVLPTPQQPRIPQTRNVNCYTAANYTSCTVP